MFADVSKERIALIVNGKLDQFFCFVFRFSRRYFLCTIAYGHNSLWSTDISFSLMYYFGTYDLVI